jgi:hypothetical protein
MPQRSRISTKRRGRAAFAEHTGQVIGPGLSAVRAMCAPYADQLAGLALVFDRIGRHLDETLSHPAADKYLCANGRRIVVAISDLAWRRGAVLITEFGVEEIGPMMTKANGFFDSYELARGGHLGPTELSVAVCGCWIEWSRHARESFRRKVRAWNDLADVSVGALLLASPHMRRELDRIAISGNVPVLAIALNSAQATATHLKCNIRSAALSLPAWMRASGAVAGNG